MRVHIKLPTRPTCEAHTTTAKRLLCAFTQHSVLENQIKSNVVNLLSCQVIITYIMMKT